MKIPLSVPFLRVLRNKKPCPPLNSVVFGQIYSYVNRQEVIFYWSFESPLRFAACFSILI
jgi:hypothetical protein